MVGFNTQPPEGGWGNLRRDVAVILVSTHSRPKAAGSNNWQSMVSKLLFQHTAARRRLAESEIQNYKAMLFQHTAARRRLARNAARNAHAPSFNTQPPEGGWPPLSDCL